MNTKLAKKILLLREQQYTYDYIADKLGCSKGTVSYYCGNNQKNKTLNRNKQYRNSHVLNKKIYKFNSEYNKDSSQHHTTDKTIIHKLSTKIRKFGDYKPMFKAQELLNKIGDNPVCYLTGRPIDLNDSKSYHLDHIIPKSKGGDNSLNNCQISSRIANMSKTEMTYDEYISLCREVVVYADTKK